MPVEITTLPQNSDCPLVDRLTSRVENRRAVKSSLRVLLALHHQLDPNQGAAGATVSLGTALERAGCHVEYFGYEHAFPRAKADGVGHAVRFPWRLASLLDRYAQRFDVIDVSTGDNWIWALRGRRGASGQHALVTRSHGLEHTAAVRLRNEARSGKVRLSWKYPLYHGGFRLWEVKQSLQLADHVFLLNEADRQYAECTLHIPAERISTLPNGIGDHFIGLPPPMWAADQALRMAFLGRWTHAKGADVFSDAVQRVTLLGLEPRITVLGAMTEPECVLESFHPSLRQRITVVPQFLNRELPRLLIDHDLFIFPSVSEGFSLALVEAMACGLAPLATPVGGAQSVIRSGSNGMLVPVGDAAALADTIARLASDRDSLLEMRRRAQETARGYRWEVIAGKTIQAYECALSRRRQEQT